MKVLSLFLVLLLAACSNGPNSENLQKEVVVKLDSFQNGLFKISDFARRGSYTYSKDGPHLLVYFKMQVELLQDYQFGDWKNLGANSLISILGSTEAGIQGINPKGNKKGDQLTIYGSNNYKKANDGWALTQSVSGQKGSAKKKGFVSDLDAHDQLDKGQRPGYRRHLDTLKGLSKQLVKNARKDPSHLYTFESKLKELIEDTQIAADTGKGYLGIATAGIGGEYHQFGKTIESVLSTKKLKYKSYPTRGSQANIDYVANKTLTFGVAQGDMLGKASKQGSKLKAVMSLFPEAIHVVALKSSNLKNVEDLRGKRVNIGRYGSGSNFHAKLVLSMHGIDESQIAASYLSVEEALLTMKAGQLDAVIFTGAYPFRPLLNFVKSTPVNLLHLSKDAVQELQTKQNITLTVPKNTYPNQDYNLIVAGTTAVLFTHEETPTEVVNGFLKNLFDKQEELAAQHKRAANFSKDNRSKGVLLDFHPGAKSYFQ
jgi:TRAP transporter TAXI family solute receptor